MSIPHDDTASTPLEGALRLVGEIERAASELDPAGAVAVRSELVRVGEAMLALAIGAALAGSGRKAAPSDDVVELEEAKRILHREESWIYHEWKRLKLGYRDGGRLLFRRSALERYVAKRQGRA